MRYHKIFAVFSVANSRIENLNHVPCVCGCMCRINAQKLKPNALSVISSAMASRPGRRITKPILE